MKTLFAALSSESRARSSALFKVSEIDAICSRLQLRVDVLALVEVMRDECLLLLKGPKLYQLNVG